ncbi:hypothetical protein PHLCEN_2v6246 [Hermanssonia centrifuga]|uniref:Nucleotide exchange factor Fes1 domain-containing protein n=1 Tax=Hermanssonia centrifuga TaxID=98765 RepID=A0A2R6NZX7_9APHY|nr:hypothetical protein PHLCEN_2v6246 [Hermanssonia centrifuga]
MQSLLRWGIENSNDGGTTQGPQEPHRKLDPEVIDMILGKPDSELMKEALAIAVDEKCEEEERLQALDNFEMLVEHIDNANDLVKMKMWEPLQGLLTSSSSSDEIKRQTLWIIGTALQNNPAAQISYLALSPVEDLVAFLSPSVRSAKTRSKAVYALSGLLKHCAPAVQQFGDADGWNKLKAALEGVHPVSYLALPRSSIVIILDSDIAVRRKSAFLLNSLLIPTTEPVPRPVPNPPAPSGSPSGDTSVTLHPSAPHPTQEPEASGPVHPNSHSSMLSDPSSVSTSGLAARALEEQGLLQALINALVSPVPYGPDGESDEDAEFEEKIFK